MNKRIKSLNTGTKRLLLVIGIIVSFTLSVMTVHIGSLSSTGHGGINLDDTPEVMLIAGLFFIGFGVLVRIVLWVIDGFNK